MQNRVDASVGTRKISRQLDQMSPFWLLDNCATNSPYVIYIGEQFKILSLLYFIEQILGDTI